MAWFIGRQNKHSANIAAIRIFKKTIFEQKPQGKISNIKILNNCIKAHYPIKNITEHYLVQNSLVLLKIFRPYI